MKILLHTTFYPSVGGIETVARLLADQWSQAGETVTIVSDMDAPTVHVDRGYDVHYRPDIFQWVYLMQECHVFVHMNISLKTLWPLLFARRPFVAVHHTFYYRDETHRRDWRDKSKLWLMNCATNIAVCRAAAVQVPGDCSVIVNPVDLRLFQVKNATDRCGDIIFVGRLVSEKGCDLLIKAICQLRVTFPVVSLTIVGDGPERAMLERLVSELHLGTAVEFHGSQAPEVVSNLMQKHKVLVIPSVGDEMYPIVALEGVASGCIVVGAATGGVAEAIGPCGITFTRGDQKDLEQKLEWLLLHRELWSEYRAQADAHLARHRPGVVAKQYLEVFEKAIRKATH